ncbi:Rha family transcriptional regulator [Orbus wheelerorum]|uniref:Rha family transcriptional regulator n=1 Tax=Orbus wheelerorum TaxID=3074111 RepID=UPI00370D9F62
MRHTINDCENNEYTQRNFSLFDFIDKNGEIQPAYNLTRNGFMLLVMSLTGKAALRKLRLSICRLLTGWLNNFIKCKTAK